MNDTWDGSPCTIRNRAFLDWIQSAQVITLPRRIHKMGLVSLFHRQTTRGSGIATGMLFKDCAADAKEDDRLSVLGIQTAQLSRQRPVQIHSARESF